MAFSKLDYLKELRGAKMKDSTFRVLVMLSTYSGADGRRAYPGNDRLALDADTSPSTVKRALKELMEQGWIQRVSRGGRSGDGAHWAAEYALCSTGQFDASTGQSDGLNGSNEWGQQFTDEPPSGYYSSGY